MVGQFLFWIMYGDLKALLVGHPQELGIKSLLHKRDMIMQLAIQEEKVLAKYKNWVVVLFGLDSYLRNLRLLYTEVVKEIDRRLELLPADRITEMFRQGIDLYPEFPNNIKKWG